jgi:hypothetical protein
VRAYVACAAAGAAGTRPHQARGMVHTHMPEHGGTPLTTCHVAEGAQGTGGCWPAAGAAAAAQGQEAGPARGCSCPRCCCWCGQRCSCGGCRGRQRRGGRRGRAAAAG